MPSNPDLVALFQERFAQPPAAVAFAPGRVNLIGEHTDYNDGFVLPLAIQFGVTVAGRLTDTGRVRAFSLNFPDRPAAFPLAEEPAGAAWDHYLRALFLELAAAGVVCSGADLVYHGDVPDGAGLSSSAAFAVATGKLLAHLTGFAWESIAALARVCQAAEHRIGVRCGLLDQMASAGCRTGGAMLLDCRSLNYEMVPLDRDRLAIVLGDTTVRRVLSDGRYNQRREECEQAAAALGVASLREVDFLTLETRRLRMPSLLYRRARHVLTENERVHLFAAALGDGALSAAGRLLDESHASLRNDYEVSCPELDAMAASFLLAGAAGARMVGGGFGGAAIALVEPEQVAEMIAHAGAEYLLRTGRTGVFHVVAPGDGAWVRSL